jgi:hypothetical protein
MKGPELLRKCTLLRKWILLVAVGLIGIGLARATLLHPANDFPGAHFNQGRNAIWLGIEWVNEVRAISDIQLLADELKRHQITYVFAYTSYLRSDGTFNPTYAHAPAFISAMRFAQPALKILAWIGLPLRQPGGDVSHGNVDLTDASVRQKIVTFCSNLINHDGFDGIHLDPEPVMNGDGNLLALLDELRHSTGTMSLSSIATPHIWPILPDVHWPLVGQVMWLGDYYREVARRVDQIALMTYDSTLPMAYLYRLWTRFQVIALSQALAKFHTEALVGIPTSEELTVTHQPVAENMSSGLHGLIDGLNDTDTMAERITGAAIYPQWETDSAEWTTYESLWLGASPR